MTKHHPAIAIALLALAVPSLSQVIPLAATIRDFNNSDSSFNNPRQDNSPCPGTGYVQSTLGPNRKPIPTHLLDVGCNPGDSARMANLWFTTDPTYTNSATTCIDIPMKVDSNGLYTFNSTSFFPLDTFTTLPNGNPNPFNTLSRAADGRQHNFSFCMEMHGTFDYQAGQVFRFAGDDDVYFYINNKLEVDLGGTHAPQNGAVNLDTLGLTAGRNYPWDLFYCERHTTGSDILISTSMNLRTTSNFTLTDSVLGNANRLFSLWVDQSNADGCVARATHSSGVGKFTLTGDGLTGTKVLPVGRSYGGITVATGFGSVQLDSSMITGLAPGNYVLHIFQQGSATSSMDVPFVVPLRPRSIQFVGSTGSMANLPGISADVYEAVPVYLEAFRDTTFCNTCQDSVTFASGNAHLQILASPDGPPITAVRLVGGKAEVWLRSTVPVAATYVVAQSDSATTPAVRSPVVVVAPTLVFLDSVGQILTTPPALNLPLGAKTTIRMEVVTSKGAVCTACSDSVALTASTGRLQFLGANGLPATRVPLQGGKASIQLVGWVPVQAASFSATTDSLLAAASWAPVNVVLGAVSGTLVDSDADGRADLLHLTIPADAGAFESLQVSWPDTDGVLETHPAPLPPSGSDLWIPVPPFEFGSTTCPATGCANLGRLAIVRGSDSALVPFPVLDGVNPIPVSADYRYRYTTVGDLPDTLVVRFSEEVRSSSVLAPWVSIGRPGIDSLGTALAPLALAWLSEGGREAWFLVDNTNGIRVGDSLRISAAPSGALADSSGNAPGRLAWWTPIVWHQPPPVLEVAVRHPVVSVGSDPVPDGESPITLLTHPDQTQTTVWTATDGPAPEGLETRFGGVVVRLNRVPSTLGMYVYDHLGVFVLKQEFANIPDLAASDALHRDQRGYYEIWLAWNGKDGRGRDAAAGIYTIRIFGRIEDAGRSYMLNILKKQGVHRAPSR